MCTLLVVGLLAIRILACPELQGFLVEKYKNGDGLREGILSVSLLQTAVNLVSVGNSVCTSHGAY